MKRVFILFLIGCLGFGSLHAQLDLNKAFPQDPHVKKGTLKNGLTYYLRHNEEPKERASFYIIRNAGALLETKEQDGLAHFLEHMSFNGTKNFPKKGIISLLEKYGVSFGRNINAYTTQNETVYNISEVPTNIPELLDTCLLILHDWVYYLALEEEEIDAERGVITEEWRQRRTPQFRIRAQIFPVITKGSQYAVRDVIGSLNVIQNFEYQAIRDFYHKWYRTDLTAIAICGNFDVDKMEKKIVDLFSSLPAVKNPQPRPFYEIPEYDEMRYVLATDKEIVRSDIQIISFKREDVKPEDKNLKYYRDAIISNFYNTLVSSRFSELIQKPNPPFIGGSFGFYDFAKGYNSFSVNTTAKPNEEEAALKAVLTELERVKRFGFLNSELERAKINLMASMESAYRQKEKTTNDAYIKSMQDNFLENDPMIDFTDYYNFVKTVVPTITVEEVSAKSEEIDFNKNTSISISGPENVKHLTETEAKRIIQEISDSKDIEPYVDNTVNAGGLIREELKGGSAVSEKRLPKFDAVEWTLENGAKVVFRKADFEKDKVSLTSRSEGGTSLYDIDMLPSATNAADFVSAFGLGEYDPVSLSKMLTGKIAGVGARIGGLTESVSGSSTPADFETMLQLLYMKFEHPRFDEVIFNNAIERSRASLKQTLKNPQKIMQDSVTLIMSDYHPRVQLYNEDYLNSLTLDKIKQVYLDRIKDASDFTFFIVGNIEESTVKPLVEKYIGSIKSYNRKETWVDHKIEGPKGKTEKKIELELTEPKSTVLVSISSDKIKYTPYDRICAGILESILELRYTESIREREGGTYGVSVGFNINKLPKPSYSLSLNFECDPNRVDRLKPLLYHEIETLIKEGVKAEDLDKTVKNMRKNHEQSKQHNAYWMNVLYNYYTTGIDNTDPKNFEDIINKITTKDIQKWAKKFYKKADIVDIVFEPKK